MAKTRCGHFIPSTTWPPTKTKKQWWPNPPKTQTVCTAPQLALLDHSFHWAWLWFTTFCGLGWAQLRSFQVSAHEQAGFPAWNCILRRGGKGEAMVEEGQSLQCWSPRKKQNKITHFCCTFTFFFPQKKVMMFGIERQPSHTHKALRSALSWHLRAKLGCSLKVFGI